MKLAIVQMADTPQISSTAMMLNYAGYEVRMCGTQLRNELQAAGCDTVIAYKSMLDIGYDPLKMPIQEASVADMDRCDLFCEIKCRNVPKIIKRWPRLKNRICWWRVNGARPEICEKGGDEINIDYPVVGANLWYGTEEYNRDKRNYVFWPPFPRAADYDPAKREGRTTFDAPFCLCHGINGWGFYGILARCINMGVDVYGVNAPKGILPHSKVPALISNALCMVHIKSVDCPGWAIYESMLSGCPIIVANLLINRMCGQELFIHGETCMAFGPPGDETGRGDMKFDECVADIAYAIDHLKHPVINKQIGMNGRNQLLKLMWDEQRDGESFKKWLSEQFA